MANITIPLSADTEAALDRVAGATNRSRDEVAAEALLAFAQDEAEIVEAIARARADVDTGSTVSHAEAMERLMKAAHGH